MKNVNRPSQSTMKYINVRNRKTGVVEKCLNVAYKEGKKKTKRRGETGKRRSDKTGRGHVKVAEPYDHSDYMPDPDEMFSARNIDFLNQDSEFVVEKGNERFERQNDIAYWTDGFTYRSYDTSDINNPREIASGFVDDPGAAKRDAIMAACTEKYGDVIKEVMYDNYEGPIDEDDHSTGADIDFGNMVDRFDYYPHYTEYPKINGFHDKSRFVETIIDAGLYREKAVVPQTLVDELDEIGFFEKNSWDFNNIGDGYRDSYGGFKFDNKAGLYSLLDPTRY